MKRIVANLKQSFICRYCVISLLRFGKSDIHCVQKKHPLTFSFISPWIICGFLDFNKNCGKYTQGLIDSDNVKIIYSLRSMTYLWRHICLAKAGASLQHATPRISFFASTGYLLVHRRGHIVYYVVEFKTIILPLNKLRFICYHFVVK